MEKGLECFASHSEAGFVYGGFHYINAGGNVTGESICRDIGPEPSPHFFARQPDQNSYGGFV